MRTLVHLSDLHFGRVDPELAQPLADAIGEVDPDLVVVSGDLTQRARPSQFRAARSFLDELPRPQVVVPGNHDIPLYRPERFVEPLGAYRRWLDPNPEPFHLDAEMAVAGVNTARSLVVKGGRINGEQMRRVQEHFSWVHSDVARLVVAHHPFDGPSHRRHRLVGRARRAMRSFAECGVDVLLTGHLHLSYAGHTAERWRVGAYAAVVIHAGTATSLRGRGETNSFNVIRLDRRRITVWRFDWQPDRTRFVIDASVGPARFEKIDGRWMPA